MPLYIGDYLGDTQRLTTEQHGAYFLLILDYWRNGAPPDDDAVLRQITRLDVALWRKHRPVLAKLFQLEGGEWRHKRIEREMSGAKGRADKGSAGGSSRWDSDDAGSRGRHMRSQRISEARRKGTHTAAEWQAMIEFCGDKCVRCDNAEAKLVKDHITPIYKGGSDAIENLQPLCQPCNASKGPEDADHRPFGWKDAIRNACVEGNSRLPNAKTSPSPSPEPNGSSSVAKATSRRDDFPRPDFATPEVWRDFLANRKTKKLRNTPTAHKGFLEDIERHTSARWPPGKLLEYAVRKGWGAIYEPKDDDRNGTGTSNGSTKPHRRADDIDDAARNLGFGGGFLDA